MQHSQAIIALFMATLAVDVLASDYKTEYITSGDGLVNNSVNCIYQDADNTLWFGTWGGLCSYDSRDFKTYRCQRNNENTLSNNVVRNIMESGRYLWVSTDNGINRIDRRTRKIKRFFIVNHTGHIPSTENTFFISKDSKNNIYCYHKGHGLYKYDGERFVELRTDFATKVSSFNICGNMAYMLFNNGNVYCTTLPNNADRPTTLKRNRLKLLSTGVNRLFRLDSNAVTLHNDGIMTLHKGSRRIASVKLSPDWQITSLAQEKNGKILICTIGNGCIELDMATKNTIHIAEVPSNASVTSAFAGGQDILWIGTDGRGVIKRYVRTPMFSTVHCEFPVRCLCQTASGTVIAGTKGGGIKLLDKATGSLTPLYSKQNGLENDFVYALTRNAEGYIFVGSDGHGIDIISPNGQLSKLILPNGTPQPCSIYNIKITHNGRVMWVGTSGQGLFRMDINRYGNGYAASNVVRFSTHDRHHYIANDIIYAISPDSDGRFIWVGSRGGGVVRIDMTDNKVIPLNTTATAKPLSDDDIICLLATTGRVIVGTSYGMNIISRGKNGLFKTTSLNVQGIESATIHSITEDDRGNIYASSNNGLYSISTAGVVKKFTTNDGLCNNEFADEASFRDSQGAIYFGDVGGISYFNPRLIRHRDFAPRLELATMMINNSNVHDLETYTDDKGNIHLDYDERNIMLCFVAKDFINSNSCEFAYRINGVKEWINVGANPRIALSLLPGKHRLEVRCTNGDKVWGNHTFTYTITVGRPWWFSPLALCVYAVLAGGLLTLLYLYIRNRLRLQRELFLASMDKRQAKKLYISKLRFFTKMAQEFFTPLTLISVPAQKLAEKPTADDETRKYASLIRDNAERMKKLVDGLTDLHRAYSTNAPMCAEYIALEPLLASIVADYQRVAEQERHITLTVETDTPSTFHSDKSLISRILCALLSNAFYHTPARGFVTLKVWQEQNGGSLLLQATNTGHGMTQKQIDEAMNGYGMFEDDTDSDFRISSRINLNIMFTLTESLGGKASISSVHGKNVTVKLDIPPLTVNETETNSAAAETENTESHDGDNDDLYADSILLYIVEGDSSMRKLFDELLNGYEVRYFDDGDTLQESIRHNSPDLIITDLQATDAGTDLVRSVKSDSVSAHIPLIAVSSVQSVEEEISAYSAGADMFFTMPFHHRQLTSGINNLLNRQTMLKDYFNSRFSFVTIKNGKDMYEEDLKLMSDIDAFIRDNLGDSDLTPETIARHFGLSKASFYRRFKELFNSTPTDHVNAMRMKYAAHLLVTSRMTVAEVLYKAGYSSKSYFYREFKRIYGCSPNDYRRK